MLLSLSTATICFAFDVRQFTGDRTLILEQNYILAQPSQTDFLHTPGVALFRKTHAQEDVWFLVAVFPDVEIGRDWCKTQCPNLIPPYEVDIKIFNSAG